MEIKVNLKKDDAVRLGLESYGELNVELDIAKLTQEQRNYLASTQAGNSCLELDHRYNEPGGYSKWKLFPPTPEGVIQLVEFAMEKDRAYKIYSEKQNAERKAQEEAEEKLAEERREKLITHLLTLSDEDFLLAAARDLIEVPGENKRIPTYLVLKDPRLRPQVDRRNARLAEIKRQGEEEKHRRTERKAQQITDWVAEHGTESQKKRFAVKLLDEQEVIDALRDAALAPLNAFHPYERLTAADVEHTDDCNYPNVEFEVSDGYATEPVFAQLEQMQALLPGALITPREHTGKCTSCEAETTSKSLLVKVISGEFSFTRDYAVPEIVTE